MAFLLKKLRSNLDGALVLQPSCYGSCYHVAGLTSVPSGTAVPADLIGMRCYYFLAHDAAHVCPLGFLQNAIGDTLTAGKVSQATEVAASK